MTRHLGQLARHRPIQILHDGKIGGEQDIEIALHHVRRRHRHRPALEARLHHGGIEPRHRVGQRVKIRGHELVQGEIGLQDVEELEQARRDELRVRQVGREGQVRLQPAKPPPPLQRMAERPRAGRVPDLQEARRHRLDVGGVEFEEIAPAVDEHGALQRGLGEGIVADAVVREIVEDFESEEIARSGDVGLPGEYGSIDDLDVGRVAARGGVTVELVGLQGGERSGDFNDFELGARVDVRVVVANVVQDIEHKGSVAGAEFVDYEVVEGVVGEFVVCDEVACN